MDDRNNKRYLMDRIYCRALEKTRKKGTKNAKLGQFFYFYIVFHGKLFKLIVGCVLVLLWTKNGFLKFLEP